MRMVLLLLFLVLGCGACAAAEDASGDLERILAKPEYNRWRDTLYEKGSGADFEIDSPSWLDNLIERVREWWKLKSRHEENKQRGERRSSGSRINTGAAGVGFFSFVGYALLAVAGAFLVISIVLYLRDRTPSAVAAEPKERVGMAKALEEGDALAYDDREWREQANLFLDSGELRLAYRSLYLGLLSGLHEQGRIVFAANRTNWHYVRFYRGENTERRELASMTEVFDHIWYGLVPVLDSAGLDNMRVRVATLLKGGSANA